MRVYRATGVISLALPLALAMLLGPIGCGHSSSDSSADEGIPGLTSADREAQSAAMAELQRHWRKGSDGWTTAIVSGSPYAPDHFLRQCRALTIKAMVPQNLSESDKLNGFEWVGRAEFESTSCREGGGQPGDGFGRHVERGGQQAQRPMEPVGGLHPGPVAFRA